MEEKVLITSEQYDVKKLFKKMVIIGAVLSVILFCVVIRDKIDNASKNYISSDKNYLEHRSEGDCGWWYDEGEKCWDCELIEEYPTQDGYVVAKIFNGIFYDLLGSLIPVAAFALIGGLIYLWLRSYELTVTDKRIYGKVAFGNRVDLPVDSVSATATTRLFKGVSVSTSSGRISFLVIKNGDAIYRIINDLLIKRQQEKANATVTATVPQIDEADKIKKYKDLLDSGVITQEEFDVKKKQILGL